MTLLMKSQNETLEKGTELQLHEIEHLGEEIPKQSAEDAT
jgi:hypothetical protein